MKKDNLTVVLGKFARKLNFQINLQQIYDELLIHPDYPSLLALSDVLQYSGISNSAYRVNKQELEKIPCPVIAHTIFHGGDFLLVDNIDIDFVTVSDHRWNRHKIDRQRFITEFDGVILVADEMPGKPLPSKKLPLSLLETPLAFIAFLIAFFNVIFFHTSYLGNINWHVGMLTVVKSAGLFVSVLLLIQSFDSNNPLVQRLCQAGGRNNCKDILSSNAAKVFEGLSWSEVGFFYFSSTWLLLLFGGASALVMQSLAIFNVICLPYTFYSIYYQARVAKQWCVLCCTIQALLWLEFTAVASSLTFPLLHFTASEISLLAIVLVLPVTAWIFLKPLLLSAQQIHPLKVQLQKFKYNADLFEKTLISQPKYTQPSEEWSIVLGNSDAENVITMVSNPYCPPCAKMHKALHNLLEQRSDMQARIVFTATNTDDDIKTPISRHMMTLNGLADKSIVKQALDDWYEQKQKNYERWAKAYPVEPNETEHSKIDRQNAWCKMAEVTATPTMLLNGYKLPGEYQLKDLRYMLQ